MIEREVLARVAVKHDDDGDLLVRRFADAGLEHVESDVLLDDLDDGVLDAHRAHRAVVVGLALDLVPRLGPALHERRARRDDVEHLDQPIIYAVAEPIVAVSAQRAVPEALRRRVVEERVALAEALHVVERGARVDHVGDCQVDRPQLAVATDKLADDRDLEGPALRRVVEELRQEAARLERLGERPQVPLAAHSEGGLPVVALLGPPTRLRPGGVGALVIAVVESLHGPREGGRA